MPGVFIHALYFDSIGSAQQFWDCFEAKHAKQIMSGAFFSFVERNIRGCLFCFATLCSDQRPWTRKHEKDNGICLGCFHQRRSWCSWNLEIFSPCSLVVWIEVEVFRSDFSGFHSGWRVDPGGILDSDVALSNLVWRLPNDSQNFAVSSGLARLLITLISITFVLQSHRYFLQMRRISFLFRIDIASQRHSRK